MLSANRRRVAVLFALVAGLVVSSSALVSSFSPPSSNNPIALAVKEHGLTGPNHDYAPVSFSAPTTNGIIVGHDARHDTTPPLRDMPLKPVITSSTGAKEREYQNHPAVGQPAVPDGALQNKVGPGIMPTTTVNFEGIDYAGASPPDTVGEVGNTQFVMMTNAGFQVSFEVWDKSGTVLIPASGISTIWQGFGGSCELDDATDPIVLYDQLASRWVLTQVSLSSGTTYECIAVSASDDATGSWHRYAFGLEPTNFPDYPKLGVWPDAYYMSANVFSSNYLGMRPYAFDRTNMLQGNAATFQTTASYFSNYFSLLPFDLDGFNLPPSGTPNYEVALDNADANYTLFKYHVDWNNPANSTFASYATITPAAYTQLPSAIPQPGTTQRLDSLGDRPMFRAAYRVFSDHDALTFTHSVLAGAAGGVRWYEVRNLANTPTIFQQGTFAPADGNFRWMGSSAFDSAGNLVIGYTVSSGSTYPSVDYAGRLASDPLGQMSQGESSIITGTHSQTTINRWGDYSDTTIDPSNDCTFWHTNEYVLASGHWATRVGAFKFPNCPAGTPTPTITPGGPTFTPTSTPVIPTNTPTPALTDTPTQVATATPTGVSTSTPVLTDTATPVATDTPQPSVTPTDCPNVFVDITGNVFYGAIHYLACRSVVNGVDATHYGPAGTSTRGQFAKVVVLGFGIPLSTPAAPDFTDVPPSYFAYVYIESGFANGILSGFDAAGCTSHGATFPCYLPNLAITRGQLTKLVVSAAHYALYTPTTPDFSDVPPNNVFYTSIETAFHKGVVGGYPDHTFRPNNNIRRDEMAQIVFKGVTTP